MLETDEDEFKRLVLGLGIGILLVLSLWVYQGYHADAFGSTWNGFGLLALGIGLILFAIWWMID